MISENLFAGENAEAIARPDVTAAATIDEQAWLEALLDGKAFHPEKLGMF